MLSESLVSEVDSVRRWQLGLVEVGAILVCKSVVDDIFLGPRFRGQRDKEEGEDEDKNARRVEGCASSSRWEESM
jgi:hypothetical protein